MRERTYWPELCVVQLAGEHEVAVIDAQAPDLDLAPLGALLADQAVMKVFHAARQDIEIFVLRFGDVPRPLFDTQVAAMVAGFGEQVGYEALVVGAHRRIDRQGAPVQRLVGAAAVGRRRSPTPPPTSPICARSTRRLCARLEQDGRLDWVAEEMAELADPATYRADPEAMWERLRPRSTNRRFLGMLRALAAWREREAQRVNIPRQRAAARRDAAGDRRHRADDAGRAGPRPRHQPRLRRGPHRRVAARRDRRGEGAAGGRAAGGAARSATGARPSPALVSLLKVLLAAKCEDHHVAARLVASSDDIERLADRGRARTSPRCTAGDARCSARTRWR